MKPFDKEEQKLMESIENEEWVSVDNLDEEIKKAREAARKARDLTRRNI